MLARTIIAKFCQNVSETPNQGRIMLSNHVWRSNPAVARTTTPNTTPRAVEVFIINYRIVVPKESKNGFSYVQAFHNADESQSFLEDHKCKELQDPFHQEHESEYHSEDHALQM